MKENFPFNIEGYIETSKLPPLEVRHKNLKRVQEDSAFKSECPSCETGLLLVKRNMETFVVENEDICTHCGQRFKYIDIEQNSMILVYKK